MFLNKLKKRDGRIVDFDSERIKNAIHRAFLAVELENGKKAESVTEDAIALLKERFRTEIPSVENVQNIVVEVLKKKGYDKVARAYEDYRIKKGELRALRETRGRT